MKMSYSYRVLAIKDVRNLLSALQLVGRTCWCDVHPTSWRTGDSDITEFHSRGAIHSGVAILTT